MKKFSAQYHINRVIGVLLDEAGAPVNDLLDTLDEVERTACADCVSRPDCLSRDCEHCRFRAELTRIVNDVLDRAAD